MSQYENGWMTVMKIAKLQGVTKAVSRNRPKPKMLRDAADEAKDGVTVGDAVIYGGIPLASGASIYSSLKK